MPRPEAVIRDCPITPVGQTSSSPRDGWYYAYVWDSHYEWGSIDTPDPNQYYVYPIIGQQIINLSALPRPLQPGLVAPCNGCLVGLGNFYLKWTDGLDADRRSPSWPAY
jgi:hypothetical protein